MVLRTSCYPLLKEKRKELRLLYERQVTPLARLGEQLSRLSDILTEWGRSDGGSPPADHSKLANIRVELMNITKSLSFFENIGNNMKTRYDFYFELISTYGTEFETMIIPEKYEMKNMRKYGMSVFQIVVAMSKEIERLEEEVDRLARTFLESVLKDQVDPFL